MEESMILQRNLLSKKAITFAVITSLSFAGHSSIVAQAPPTGQAKAGMMSDLHVSGAYLNPKSKSTVVTLLNTGKKAVISYALRITVASGGKVLGDMSHSLDLTDVVLDNSDFSENDDHTWTGAIKPGEVYSDIQSLPASYSGAASPNIPFYVNAKLMGVVWSDGRIESVDSAWNTILKRSLDANRLRAGTEERILAILDTHKDDADIQKRLSGISSDILALKPTPATPTDALAVIDGTEAFEINVAGRDVASFQIATDPAGAFESYKAYYRDHHNRRLAVLRRQGALPLP